MLRVLVYAYIHIVIFLSVDFLDYYSFPFSFAGSLLNLAKHPSSTVQILGAEKALFRYVSLCGSKWMCERKGVGRREGETMLTRKT